MTLKWERGDVRTREAGVGEMTRHCDATLWMVSSVCTGFTSGDGNGDTLNDPPVRED